MKTLMLEIKESNTTSAMLEYIAGPPDPDGSIYGKFVNQPQNSVSSFLAPCREGKLFTITHGHRYGVTGLTDKGNFKLVPYPNPA